jgi:hypothetical protein
MGAALLWVLGLEMAARAATTVKTGQLITARDFR